MDYLQDDVRVSFALIVDFNFTVIVILSSLILLLLEENLITDFNAASNLLRGSFSLAILLRQDEFTYHMDLAAPKLKHVILTEDPMRYLVCYYIQHDRYSKFHSIQ